ncbi:hypothetical protein UFOVP1552_25 [uncultured Caudovirales phage]|uniref:Uncharacterized protein n=1 Tax=uncultured Caudovirales phage TaxID=2100421 RepID=A0A6J5PPC1_9CAUD|nr:hypothetical protein UFOVP933_25 [uncultured Caudovirales phage]CAB4177739.1 hypothetical protein UFOVP1014_44 [uncultured Caudovirales phage]CAB4202538.1 hypothetical protein UFOVP1368_18 [uncultured Caudovirales phage]CAB5229243.1 hypothetical protein UFOVP1552_25 [uncultured Caudovirales phage]
MPLAPINVPPGVMKLATPLQTKGRYWDANLVRWRAGKLLPVGGWQRVTSTPLSSTIRGLFPWNGADGATYTAVGCEDKLYILNGSTYTDVTPPSFVPADSGAYGGYGAYNFGYTYYGLDTDATYPRPPTQAYIPTFSWTLDNWGGDLLAVASSDGRLLHWNHGETVAGPVGTSTITTIVRVSNVATVTTVDHHGYLAGQTVVISGNSVGAFNGTVTIVTAPTDTTFTFALSGANTTGNGGSVTATRAVPTNNRGVIVTSERHCVLIGAEGNARRVAWSSSEDYTEWDFANPANTAGYLDLDTQSKIVMCAPVREGTLIWTDNEAWIMRYVGLPYIYQIERIGFGCGLIAPQAFATTAGRCIWMGNESFWLYDGGTVRPLPCDVGSFVFEDLDPQTSHLWTFGTDNGVFPEAWFWYPSSGSINPDKYVVFSYAESWWSVGEMSRTAACGAAVIDYPLASDDEGDLYQHEDGWTAAGDPITTARYAETGSINAQNGNMISHVKQAITDSGYGYNSTQLTLFSSFTPEGTETTSGPYNPRSDGYTDMRVTGRDFRIKIAATEDAEWSIGEVRLDMTAGGGR